MIDDVRRGETSRPRRKSMSMRRSLDVSLVVAVLGLVLIAAAIGYASGGAKSARDAGVCTINTPKC